VTAPNHQIHAGLAKADWAAEQKAKEEVCIEGLLTERSEAFVVNRAKRN
jgi:hypothetical protein